MMKFVNLLLLALATGASARLGSEPSALQAFGKDVVDTDVEALRERFDVDVAGADARRRLKSCGSDDLLGCDDNLYKVNSCGVFEEESSEVCKSDGDSYCCAKSKDDCCDPNDGVIAGVSIALIVAFLLIVLSCCSCQRPTTGALLRPILAWKCESFFGRLLHQMLPPILQALLRQEWQRLLLGTSPPREARVTSSAAPPAAFLLPRGAPRKTDVACAKPTPPPRVQATTFAAPPPRSPPHPH